jgi:hypothetical protein
LLDPSRQYEGLGCGRIEVVIQTRPFSSNIGLCGPAGLSQTGLVPKCRNGWNPTCRSPLI